MNDFAKSLMDKSLAFAVRIAKLAQFLNEGKKEFVLSRQIAQSDLDFISKISIAVKEGLETQYWLEVLLKPEYITEVQYRSLRNDTGHLVGLLVRAVKSKKRNLGLSFPSHKASSHSGRKQEIMR